MTNKYIESVATKALQSVDCKQPPVPLEEIVGKMGLKIVEFDFHEGISAVLKPEHNVIGVNKNHHPVRKRFSVAHELGHFLLGHGDGQEIIDEEFGKPFPQETEANAFASALLMPAKWIKDSVAKKGLDLEELAKTYEVSKQALTIRLLALNLIK